MKLEINNMTQKIVTELEKVLEDLNEAKSFADNDIAVADISRAQGRIETIKSLLED